MKSIPRIFASGMQKGMRRLRRSGLPVLIYHRVLSEADPYRPGEPTIEQFAAQMDFIRNAYHVLTLNEAVQQMNAGSLDDSAIVITFDDGYRDNLYNAARVLSDRKMTATFFIATGYTEGRRMWNDTIIDGIKRTSLPVLDLSESGLGLFRLIDDDSKIKAADSIVRSLKYMPSHERQELADAISEMLEVDYDDPYMMSDIELSQLGDMGMELGAHTVTHPILFGQTESEILDQIYSSKSHLESILDREVTSFAYPNGRYGKDFDDNTCKLVQKAGFHCAVSTDNGVTFPGDDLYKIKRFTPWRKSVVPYSLQLIRNSFF